jgi:hypothetical protein
MSVSKSRSRTAAQGAASRATGPKSTGPKTLAGKSVGLYECSQGGKRVSRVEVSCRARCRSLLRDVLNSHLPWSPPELRMCEDITVSSHHLANVRQDPTASLG